MTPDALGEQAVHRSALMGTYAPVPVTFVRGEGSWLWDTDGKRYLDLLGGLAVTALGHAHPEVADALANQARTLVHTSNLFGTEPGPRVATALDELLGGGGQIFFANSGAEANEAAIKLARRWAGPGRAVIVAMWGGFHGRTLGALAATGQPTKQEPFHPLPEGFRHAVYGDAADLERQLDPSVAAVLVESVQGEGGVLPASPDYLRALRRLCDERGVLLVLDEVQTGLGRTGRWFGFEHAGIRPDIVTLAKSLGNGVPIGACWARREVASALQPGDHGTTFGGQPLAAAAAEKVLEILRRENAPARAERAGARLRSGLETLDGIVATRGQGLLLAGELAPGLDARTVASSALAAGLVVNAVTPTALRFAPSLLVSDDEIDEGLALLDGVLDEARAGTDSSGAAEEAT